jgi:hypothetical protein
VAARLIDARVRVRLSANQLEVFDRSRLAAAHPRQAAAGAEHLELDHYLEILARKPGALPGAGRAGAGPRFGRVHRRLPNLGKGVGPPRRRRLVKKRLACHHATPDTTANSTASSKSLSAATSFPASSEESAMAASNPAPSPVAGAANDATNAAIIELRTPGMCSRRSTLPRLEVWQVSRGSGLLTSTSITRTWPWGSTQGPTRIVLFPTATHGAGRLPGYTVALSIFTMGLPTSKMSGWPWKSPS